MTVWPLRFRPMGDRQLFFSNDAGGFFISDDEFLSRYATDELTGRHPLPRRAGLPFDQIGDLSHTAFAYRWAARQNARNKISYVMVVPTLRCNLACTYCQVSRAAETAPGFDWTDALLETFWDSSTAWRLRRSRSSFRAASRCSAPICSRKVRDFCRQRFQKHAIRCLHEPSVAWRRAARVL